VDADGRGSVFLETVVEMVEDKVGWVYWGLERVRLRWVAMKWGLEMREHHVLKTHLNLMTDFTGSRERISAITSFGRLFDIVLLFSGD
jgi:hypothetical protein